MRGAAGHCTRHLEEDELRTVARSGKLNAILDACEDPPVYEKTVELGPDGALCLHSDAQEIEERQAAPFLVRVDERMLEWLFEEPWGRPWGIFVIGDVDLRTLRPHLRSQLKTELPDGQGAYIRYFDPRVLPTLLETMQPGEFAELLGPAQGLAVPAEGKRAATLVYAVGR